MNLYAYVWNNPITFVDPYGLWGLNWPDFVNPPLGPSCAAYFLVSNFRKLKLEPDEKHGADKYYHCVAFCQVGKSCGLSGLGAGIVAGDFKERYDCFVDNESCEDLDREANRKGISFSNSPTCCEESCRDLFPF